MHRPSTEPFKNNQRKKHKPPSELRISREPVKNALTDDSAIASLVCGSDSFFERPGVGVKETWLAGMRCEVELPSTPFTSSLINTGTVMQRKREGKQSRKARQWRSE